MAIINIDTSWSGDASEFIVPALVGANSFQENMFHIFDNVRKAKTIPRLTRTTAGLTPRQVSPTDSGPTWGVDGRVLQPKSFQAFTTFTAQDLEGNFEVENLANKISLREVPAHLLSKIMVYYAKLISKKLDQMLYTGSTAYAALPDSDTRYELQFIDGIIKQMIADALVYKTSGPSTLTNSNIVTAINDLLLKCTTTLPDLLYDPETAPAMCYVMSPKSRYLYNDALVNLTYKSLDPKDGGAPNWKQYPVKTILNFPDDTILFTNVDSSMVGNLHVAMNSADDLSFEYGRVQNFDERYGILVKGKIDTTYGFAQHSFLYTTLTAASFTA
jgi:hypothetical protein